MWCLAAASNSRRTPDPIRAPTASASKRSPARLPEFKPQWDARRGAEQLYEAYSKSGLTLDEFEGPRYQRISHIKKLMADGIIGPDLRHLATQPAGAPAMAS